jgi:hypothetical protein
LGDYFYKAAKNGNERSADSRRFFEAVMNAAGVDEASGKGEEALLSEFQRKGWFVTACCECPLEEGRATEKDVAERFADAVARRVKYSYRPKRIVLAARSLEELKGKLGEIGLRDSIEMRDGMCD